MKHSRQAKASMLSSSPHPVNSMCDSLIHQGIKPPREQRKVTQILSPVRPFVGQDQIAEAPPKAQKVPVIFVTSRFFVRVHDPGDTSCKENRERKKRYTQGSHLVHFLSVISQRSKGNLLKKRMVCSFLTSIARKSKS